ELLADIAPPPRRGIISVVMATVALLGVVATVVAISTRPRVETPSRTYADGRPRPSVAVVRLVADGEPALGALLAEILRQDLEQGGRGLRAIDDARVAAAIA